LEINVWRYIVRREELGDKCLAIIVRERGVRR
jgi:hypothetical protein